MDDVIELLKTWELHELIPLFTEHEITIQALAALTHEDLKDLIPRTGPRVLFTRCWRTWKNEFSPDIDSKNALTCSGLDISNIEIEKYIHSSTENDAADLIFIPFNNDHDKNEKEPTKSSGEEIELPANKETVATRSENVLENILKLSLETSSLLRYKGGSLDGDATRNLLASIIAKEILNENKNAPIVGQIYFKWTKLIKELFPGERTTTYYIPACTTASGTINQARGKLVHQVLNKRRRFQQLGSLTAKKRNREESPRPSSSSPRPLPNCFDTSNLIPIESVQEDLMWLRNSSEPWKLVETKWKNTSKQRLLNFHTDVPSIESYFDTYPSLRKPQGYTLLHIDFEEAYKDHVDNLFIYFPVVKIKLLDLLIKRKSKKVDTFYQELVNLAESSNEEHKSLAAFLAIPYLLNTTTIKQKKKKENLGSRWSWKPSKAETRDAFIRHVRSDADIAQAVEHRLKLLKNKGASPQPYIIIVGESLKDIKTYLVVVNASTWYKVTPNILQAVDTCYKVIWSLNLEYGSDSYAIWYFLQKGLFKMTSNFDRGSTTAESLLTDCNF